MWAYNCNPAIGSEHGATWAFVRTLARQAELVVFHSAADTEQVTAWAREHADAAIAFEEVQEPASLTVIDKMLRFHRQLKFITYGVPKWRDRPHARRTSNAAVRCDRSCLLQQLLAPEPVMEAGPSLYLGGRPVAAYERRFGCFPPSVPQASRQNWSAASDCQSPPWSRRHAEHTVGLLFRSSRPSRQDAIS